MTSASASAASLLAGDDQAISPSLITEHHYEPRERCDLALLINAEEAGKFDKYFVHLEFLATLSQWFDAIREAGRADAKKAKDTISSNEPDVASLEFKLQQVFIKQKSIQVIRMPKGSLTSRQIKAYADYSYRLKRLDDFNQFELCLAARYLSDSRLLDQVDGDFVRRFPHASDWDYFACLANAQEFHLKRSLPLFRSAFFGNLAREVAKVESEDGREENWAMISKETLDWGLKHLLEHKLVKPNSQATKSSTHSALATSTAEADSVDNSKSSGDATTALTSAGAAAQAAKTKVEAAAKAAASFVCDDEAIPADKITEHHYEPRERCDLALLVDAEEEGNFDSYFVRLESLATFSQWFEALRKLRQSEVMEVSNTINQSEPDVAAIKARPQQVLNKQNAIQVIRMPRNSLSSARLKAYLDHVYRLKRCEDFNRFELCFAARYLGDSRLHELVDEDYVRRFATSVDWQIFAGVVYCDGFRLQKSATLFREAFFNNLAEEVAEIKDEATRDSFWQIITKETLVWGIKHLIANKLVIPKPKPKVRV